ncbi:MAG TPA: hypothetical protein VHC49_02740 [Mycobacteriales bacterium]|nr:hypothetical protein [Mycobacteriales bacterium]
MYLDVSPGEVDTAGTRFSSIGGDFGTLSGEVGKQIQAAAAAASNGEVSSGCSVFSSGMTGSINACRDDAKLLGGSVSKAAITYRVNDERAIVVHLTTVPAVTPGSGK